MVNATSINEIFKIIFRSNLIFEVYYFFCQVVYWMNKWGVQVRTQPLYIIMHSSTN